MDEWVAARSADRRTGGSTYVVLGTSAEMWLGLQADYDLLTAPKITGLKRIQFSP